MQETRKTPCKNKINEMKEILRGRLRYSIFNMVRNDIYNYLNLNGT